MAFCLTFSKSLAYSRIYPYNMPFCLKFFSVVLQQGSHLGVEAGGVLVNEILDHLEEAAGAVR